MPWAATSLICPETTFSFSPAPARWWDVLCPLCPCSELRLLWSRSCLTAGVLQYSWINTLCLPVGLISWGTNLTNTAVWFLSQRRFVSGQFAVSIHLPPPYRYNIVLLWLNRISCLLPFQHSGWLFSSFRKRGHSQSLRCITLRITHVVGMHYTPEKNSTPL